MFPVKHTPESVLRELIAGLNDGRIVLGDRPEPSPAADNAPKDLFQFSDKATVHIARPRSMSERQTSPQRISGQWATGILGTLTLANARQKNIALAFGSGMVVLSKATAVDGGDP